MKDKIRGFVNRDFPKRQEELKQKLLGDKWTSVDVDPYKPTKMGNFYLQKK